MFMIYILLHYIISFYGVRICIDSYHNLPHVFFLCLFLLPLFETAGRPPGGVFYPRYDSESEDNTTDEDGGQIFLVGYFTF